MQCCTANFAQLQALHKATLWTCFNIADHVTCLTWPFLAMVCNVSSTYSSHIADHTKFLPLPSLALSIQLLLGAFNPCHVASSITVYVLIITLVSHTLSLLLPGTGTSKLFIQMRTTSVWELLNSISLVQVLVNIPTIDPDMWLPVDKLLLLLPINETMSPLAHLMLTNVLIETALYVLSFVYSYFPLISHFQSSSLNSLAHPDSPGGCLDSLACSNSPSGCSDSLGPPGPQPTPDIKHLKNIIHYERRLRPNINVDILAWSARLPTIINTMAFILGLRNASTTDHISQLTKEVWERRMFAPAEAPTIDNPRICHSISMYLVLEHSLQAAYEAIFCSFKLNFADVLGVDNIQSFYSIEKIISGQTGVVPLKHDMCPNTCLAYTGPFSDLDTCSTCQASCWDQAKLQGNSSKVPAQQFTTVPLGLQLQAHTCTCESTCSMRYLWDRTLKVLHKVTIDGPDILVVNDVVMGWDYLGVVLAGDIKEHDIVLMVSLNRAQLFDSQELDCWMYIWIIVNLPPHGHYHKANILPGGFILGPNKLKNLNLFLFPGIHHLAALQCEGLGIWNVLTNTRHHANLYLLFTTTDSLGLILYIGTE